ncbi:MAG: hypothetical protein H0U59_07705 [Gemmatimonadaceae bacterium]|nr:hypothetical protein [Gemmatimonadaceae bacterium]
MSYAKFPPPEWRWRFPVREYVRALDGDTFRVLIDQGDSDYSMVTVRLEGIDCYELGDANGEGIKAAAFADSRMLEARSITIETTDARERYTFGRYRGLVFVDGKSLADLLRSAGYEKPQS